VTPSDGEPDGASRGAPGTASALLCFVGPMLLLGLAVAVRAGGRLDSGHRVAERITSILDIARATAVAEGVPLPLLLAVASAESGGRANARSPAGAVGLMQLLPGTAADMARAGGEPEPELTDPETSLRLGARYLALQIRRFADRPHGRDLALCAYNAGPRRVSQWLKRYPAELTARPPVEWVPLSETRQYVPRVAHWEARWTRRLAEDAAIE